MAANRDSGKLHSVIIRSRFRGAVIYLIALSRRRRRRSSADGGIGDDTGRPFYGVACLQADGRWHIVERD
jgi:hypothetical protein